MIIFWEGQVNAKKTKRQNYNKELNCYWRVDFLFLTVYSLTRSYCSTVRMFQIIYDLAFPSVLWVSKKDFCQWLRSTERMTQKLVDGRLFVFRSMSYFKSDDLVTCNQSRLGFLSSSLSGCRIDGVVGTCHGWVCGHVRGSVYGRHCSQCTHSVTTHPHQRTGAASGSEDRLIDKPRVSLLQTMQKAINVG